MSEFPKDPVPIAVIGGSGAYYLLGDQSLGQEINCQSLITITLLNDSVVSSL